MFECYLEAQEIENPLLTATPLKYSLKASKILWKQMFPEKMLSSSPQNESRERAGACGCNAIGFGVQTYAELLPKHVAGMCLGNMDRKTFFLGHFTEKKQEELRGEPGDRKIFRDQAKSCKLNDQRGAPQRTLAMDAFANYPCNTQYAMLSFKDDSMCGKDIVRLEVY